MVFTLMAGACAYLAYNIRSIYLYNVIFCIIGLIWINRGQKIIFQVVAAAVIICGIAAAGAPQIPVNESMFGETSIMNPMAFHPIYSSSEKVLFKNMDAVRYESNISDVGRGALYSHDPIVTAIIEKEGYTIDDFTYKSFLKLCFKYPVQMLGVYMTHFIGMLDMRFSMLYIEDLEQSFNLKVIFDFAFWFTAFLGASLWINQKRPYTGKKEKDKKRETKLTKYFRSNAQLSNLAAMFTKESGGAGWLVFYSIFPSLISVVTSVEPRFFVQINLVLIVYLAAFCPYREIWQRVKAKPVTYILLLITFFGSAAAVANLTMGLNQYLTKLLLN
jgi:hypothetical protein